MNTKLENSLWRAVGDKSFNGKNIHPAEIHRQIVEVYCEGATNEGAMRKWCRLFKECRTMRGAAARRRQYTLVTRTVQEENFRAPPSPIQFLPCFTWLSLVPPPQEIFGRPDSEERPRDKRRFAGLAGGFGDVFLQYRLLKLVPRYAKYVNLHGDCVVKFFNVSPCFNEGIF